jgi:hypothetical protein
MSKAFCFENLRGIVEAEKKKLPEGTQLSPDRLIEVLMHVLRQVKAHQKKTGNSLRDKDGNIEDFLEQRRPFINPTHDIHTH